MNSVTYQLVFPGPDPDRVETEIIAALRKDFDALGMSEAELEVLHAADADHFDPEGYNAAAAVWLAADKYTSPGPDDPGENLLKKLIAAACPVFPVVDTLTGFPDKVPPDLKPVNGIGRDEPDWRARLTRGLLAQWGLTRTQRRVFISYRRSESTGVAGQLLQALVGRGYGVFLDTISVEPGVLFQEHLWDSMSNVDLVVFLASPDALASPWVQQEISKAANVGLGVVQVIWPGSARTEEELQKLVKDKKLDESFATPFHLSLTDFPSGGATKDAVLSEPKLSALLTLIEETRVKSLGARRLRITGSILDEAARRGFTVVQHPTGVVELADPKKVPFGYGFVLPGVPDAVALYNWELLYQKMDGRKSTAADPLLIYNQIGLTTERQAHLDWLNLRGQFKAQSVEKLSDWFCKKLP